MDCCEVARILSGHPLDDLEPKVCATVEAHFGACSSCARRWSSETDSQLFRRLLAPLRTQRSVTEAVMARL